MKNAIRYLLVLLFGIIVIPTSVFAKDKNVTYFMMYPDGSREVTENYEDTINLQEKLIFTTKTDSSGKVVLCDLMDHGKIKVVQHVPDGYTSDKTEEVADLSKTSMVSFVDVKGVNPQTGRNFLFLFVLVGIVIGTLIYKKKTFYVLPIIFTFFLLYHVSADNTCFTVSVTDGTGAPIEGVTIDIYGLAEVEEAPAVKFTANGGHFFDGKTVMYFKLPSEMSEIDEFFDSLSDDEYDYFEANSDYAYRDGYYPDGYDFPEYFVNGTEVPMRWVQDYYADLVKVVGNGGVLDFFGQKLTEAYFYQDSNWPEIARYFERDGYYYMGFDRSSTCSDPIDHWILRKDNFTGKVYYLCWDTSIDGIVVNDEYIFMGRVENCFERSNFRTYNASFEFMDSTGRYYLNLYQLEDGRYGLSKLMEYLPKVEMEATLTVDRNKPIQKLEIIDHKQSIITITSDDLESVSGEEYSYIIVNDEKNQIIDNFYRQLSSRCIVTLK